MPYTDSAPDNGSMDDDGMDNTGETTLQFRPWWRRPHPFWALPFLFNMGITLGMGSSVNTEIFISLVCLTRQPLPIEGLEYSTVNATYAPPLFPGIDPAACRRDIAVQRHAANLEMLRDVVGGILTVLTTAFWSGLSDGIGRGKIWAICELGLLGTVLLGLFNVYHPQIVVQTDGYWLLLGTAMDSLLGGFVTISSVASAYVADSSSGTSLVTHFAIQNGVFMVARIIGPLLGNLAVKRTGDLMMPYKIGLGTHALAALALVTILPESLSAGSFAKEAASAREEERAREAERQEREEAADSSSSQSGLRKSVAARMFTAARRLMAPLESLSTFLPRKVHADPVRKDWNLFLLAVTNFILTILSGIAGPEVLYALYTFGWDSAQLGQFFSLLAACRFTALMVVVPFITRYLKPYYIKRLTTPTPSSESETPTEHSPLLPEEASTMSNEADCPSSTEEDVAKPKRKADPATIAFDHKLLCACLIIHLAAYTLTGTNVEGSQIIFVGALMLQSFSAPANPCASSLVVELAPKDVPAGRIFGALGVLDALGSTLLSPLLFNSIWAATIEWYPTAMYLVAAVGFLVALLLATALRLPQRKTAGIGRV